MKQVYIVETRLDKNDKAPKKTTVTMDDEGAAREVLFGLAAQAKIVQLQGAWRRAGTVPATHSVMFKDHATGRSVAFVPTVDNIAAIMTDPAQRAELLKKLQAMK